MRPSDTASARLAPNPGAITRITAGMNSSPATVRQNSQNSSTPSASRAKPRAVSAPSCASTPENNGTNAALNAPSPNRRRNRLGSRNATW